MPSDCSLSVLESDTPTGPLQLKLAGRVSVELAKQLHLTALELSRRNRDVKVCCREVEYLDASAIQVLICLGRELEMQNRSCDLTGVTGQVRTDFSLVGLAHILADE